MNTLLALPMYAIHPPATQALMQAMVTLLAQQGMAAQPVWPEDLLTHWQNDRLLLSQTCGYPLVSQLPAVQLVGAFHYRAPGCNGYAYRSWLVARDKEATLADFNVQRAVANSLDSHSGYNTLRFVAAVCRCASGHNVFAAVAERRTPSVAGGTAGFTGGYHGDRLRQLGAAGAPCT